MHVERLERMANLLRRDAANPTGVKFDLGSWAQPADSLYFDLPADVKPADDRKDYTGLEPIKVPVACGTMACAFGLAAISGEFAAEGLSYSFMLGSFHSADGGRVGVMMPQLGRWHGMLAAAQLFGIQSEDASYFFDPENYDECPREAEGELLVAQRIDDFIAGKIDEDHHPSFRNAERDED